MKKKILLTILVALAAMSLLAGCATGLTPFSWPGASSDEERAFIAGGPYVYAVDLKTGAELWRYPEKASTANPFYAAPVLSEDGQLVFGGFDRKLYSLNPVNKAENWVFEGARDRYFGSVLIAGDVVYAPNGDYRLYAVNLKNGSLLWSFKADQSIWAAPATDGTKVYFGTVGGKINAVNLTSGELVWKTPLDSAVLGSVLHVDGTLYATTYEGSLTALNARNGEILWSIPVADRVWSGPVLAGERLYFGDSGGNLYSFALNGEQEWSQLLNGAIIASPLVSGETVMAVTALGNIYFTDLEGAEIQPVSITGELFSSPAAAGDFFLVAPTNGDNFLVALDQNGTQKWVYTPAK